MFARSSSQKKHCNVAVFVLWFLSFGFECLKSIDAKSSQHLLGQIQFYESESAILCLCHLMSFILFYFYCVICFYLFYLRNEMLDLEVQIKTKVNK